MPKGGRRWNQQKSYGWQPVPLWIGENTRTWLRWSKNISDTNAGSELALTGRIIAKSDANE